MKLTKDMLRKIALDANVAEKDIKILYNWTLPTGLTQAQLSGYNILFNNYNEGLDNFFEQDLGKPLISSLAGLSVGLTHNALGTAGYGTFSGGSDSLRISKDIDYLDWSIFLNFEDTEISSSKRRILLSSESDIPNEGFKLGLNRVKNLFFEFYDNNNILQTHTILHPINEKNIVSVSRSKSLETIIVHIFNPVDFTNKRMTIETSSPKLGSKWFLGGKASLAEPPFVPGYGLPVGDNDYRAFLGKIYEFFLISNCLSEVQIAKLSESFAVSSFTNGGYSVVDESFYKTTGFTEVQVQTGTQIVSYFPNPVYVPGGFGAPIMLFEKVPVTIPVYETKVQYAYDAVPSIRHVNTFIPALKTYDYVSIKDYAPTCLSLMTPLSGASYEVYTNNKYSLDINKRASFVAGTGEFRLERDFGSQEVLFVYLNGLLLEEGVGYLRSEVFIKKVSGKYLSSDVLIYDVIQNGVKEFSNFTVGTGNLTLINKAGKDIYISGKKLTYILNYQDSGNDIILNQTGLTSGRMAIVSRYSDINLKLEGQINSYSCVGHPLISEFVWINKLRKLKDIDYLLKNSRDPSNSDIIVTEKSTIIYDNDPLFFNI